MSEKVCIACHESKPLTDYYLRENGTPRTACKVCYRKKCREKGYDNCRTLQSIRQKQAKDRRKRFLLRQGGLHRRQKKYKSNCAAVSQWRKMHPEVHKAYIAVREAVKSGKLVRPPSCSVCGRAAKCHAHHDDYSKPLDVKWVCHLCHVNIHHPLIPLPR